MTGIQVPPSHYAFRRYVDLERWHSYWHQIRLVLEAGPSSVLEIGPGDGSVSAVLRHQGIDVVTFDHQPALKPDVVGDLRRVDTHFVGRRFDLVLCAEVLEHLPFEAFAPTVARLCRLAGAWVLITLPCDTMAVQFAFKFFKTRTRHVGFSVPMFWKEPKLRRGQHHWEVGQGGTSLGRVEEILGRHGRLDRNFAIPGNLYHRAFLLALGDGDAPRSR